MCVEGVVTSALQRRKEAEHEFTGCASDGILADYEDQNDHDTLRSDPVFKLVCDRDPQAHDPGPRRTWSRSWDFVTAHVRLRESENRNKELKRELAADRLSDHRFMANFFRLYLHAAALNLPVRLRRATARKISVNTNDLNRNIPP